MLNGSILTTKVALLVVSHWSREGDQWDEIIDFLLPLQFIHPFIHSACGKIWPAKSSRISSPYSIQSTMADAISLLRQFIVENKEFTVEHDRFVFNDLAYPKDIKTNYLVYGFVGNFWLEIHCCLRCSTGKDSTTPKEYYTLESIVFLWKNVDLQHANYVKNAGVCDREARLRQIGWRPLFWSSRNEVFQLSVVQIVKSSSPISPVKRIRPIESIAMLCSRSLCNGHRKVLDQPREHSEWFCPIVLLVNKRPADDPRLDAAKIARVEDDDMQKLKDRREKKFDEKSKEITADQIRPLSGELSKEAILKIRAKFRATARDKIVDFRENEETPEPSTEPVPITADTFEIMKRERTWRNRTTVLQSTNKVEIVVCCHWSRSWLI